MLIVRRAQMEALAAPQNEIFLVKVLCSLAQLFPDDARIADTNALRAFVQDAISSANVYQLERERELLLFIYLEFDQGPGFESRPGQAWIERMLRDPCLEGSEKLDVIYARLALATQKDGV